MAFRMVLYKDVHETVRNNVILRIGGQRLNRRSGKYPNHLFDMGRFQSPGAEYSNVLRAELTKAIDEIFKLQEIEKLSTGRLIPVVWPEAKKRAHVIMDDFDERAKRIVEPSEREWFRQALVIIAETTDFVLGSGYNEAECKFEWQELPDPAPK